MFNSLCSLGLESASPPWLWSAYGCSILLASTVFFNWSITGLQCCVRFCCTTVGISNMHTYHPSLWAALPPRPHPTPLGHHRALSWAPSAIEQLPTSSLFYKWWCIDGHAILPVHPTPSFLLRPQVRSLHLQLPLHFKDRKNTIFPRRMED